MRTRLARNNVDAKLINEILLNTSKLAIPDPKIFSILVEVSKNQIKLRSRSERLRSYWTSTGRHLQNAMSEIDSQVKESANA